jgi:hypothetical protein
MVRIHRNWNVATSKNGFVVQCLDLKSGTNSPCGGATPQTALSLVLDKTITLMEMGDTLSLNGRQYAFRQAQSLGPN